MTTLILTSLIEWVGYKYMTQIVRDNEERLWYSLVGIYLLSRNVFLYTNSLKFCQYFHQDEIERFEKLNDS